MTRSNGSRNHALLVLAAAIAASGCRSDLNQQLLERELRLQEDQIYQLQDELHFKASRLDRLAGENSSLKKQLGIVDPNASLPSRTSPPPGVAEPAKPLAAPALVPPTIEAPAVEFVPPPRAGGAPPSPPATTTPAVPEQPPVLDGVPPLPGERPGLNFRGTSLGPSAPSDGPTFGTPTEARSRPIDPQPDAAMAPPVKRLSHEESVADEKGITHLVINTSRSGLFDGDGDGRSDGLTVVFEPRDADERLIGSVGDVFVAAYDARAPLDAPPVASWEIPSQEALGHFRRTSRARGLHFVLRWPGQPPTADRLRLFVRMTTFEGRAFEREETLAD